MLGRRPRPTDRRIKSLVIAGEGWRVRDQVLVELWTTVPILEGLTDPDRQELRRLLDKAVEGAIGEAAGSGSRG